MEMYADTESRGGILEPPGICEVKFRAPDQVTPLTCAAYTITLHCATML
jgi:hypothetical protein